MKRLLVGVSGGIDSLTASLFFKDNNFEVIPLYLILHEGNLKNREQVELLYDRFNMKVIIKDERKRFRKSIIEYFIDTYKDGLTPNPCALCNRDIKFPLLKNYAKECECGGFSTGHYIRVENGRIFKGADISKDQSYFVATVGSDDLSGFINSNLSVAVKTDIYKNIKSRTDISLVQKESQEICFIQNNDYIDFLKRYGGMDEKRGDFIDDEGKKIGEHRGYFRYTVGKRRNLEMGFNERMYVKKIDSVSNQVQLTKRENLFSSNFILNPIQIFDNLNSDNLSIKTRYRQIETKCSAKIIERNLIEVNLKEKVEAVTPGQIGVIYQDDMVVASGFITKEIW
jgi:tRNA-specific 2-thiouridylase